MNELNNRLAEFYKLSGDRVLNIDGIYWYEYGGFMVPAYLPHSTPIISTASAKKVCIKTRRPFARWVSEFGMSEKTEWWYIIHDGPYNLEKCKSKTRWQINKGNKLLNARQLTADEVLEYGYDVCKKAVKRYSDNSFLISEEQFNRRVHASTLLPGVMEYFGVFREKKLVALAENIIQDNAVFWEKIWYDPIELKNYTSYVLTDFMLNEYLNNRKFLYICDGSRSIYHESNVQNFLIEKFGFQKKYAILNIWYHPIMQNLIKILYPMRKSLFSLNDKISFQLVRKLCGLLRQEEIYKSFQFKS